MSGGGGQTNGEGRDESGPMRKNTPRGGACLTARVPRLPTTGRRPAGAAATQPRRHEPNGVYACICTRRHEPNGVGGARVQDCEKGSAHLPHYDLTVHRPREEREALPREHYNQIKSNRVKSSQVKSNQVKSNQVKSQRASNQVKSSGEHGRAHTCLELHQGCASHLTARARVTGGCQLPRRTGPFARQRTTSM